LLHTAAQINEADELHVPTRKEFCTTTGKESHNRRTFSCLFNNVFSNMAELETGEDKVPVSGFENKPSEVRGDVIQAVKEYETGDCEEKCIHSQEPDV
jgi:hypothetical protein